MKFLFFSLFSLIIQTSFSKDIVYTARDYRQLNIDTLFINGDFRRSLIMSFNSLKLYPGDTDYITIQTEDGDLKQYTAGILYGNIIRCYAYLNQPDSAFLWIDSLLKNYLPVPEFFYAKEFEPLVSDIRYYKYYEPSYNTIKELYPHMDKSFFIEAMRAFYEPGLYISEIGFYSPILPPLYRDKLSIVLKYFKDDMFFKIDSLIEKYGYPVLTDSLKDNSKYDFFKLPKSPKIRFDVQNLLEENFKNGRIDPQGYARSIDIQLIYSNCPQRYGTQYWKDSTTNTYYLYPLEDENNIDRIRAQIGLFSIHAQIHDLGLEKIEYKDDGKKY
ncbi:MAG: hypothetical protein JWN78_1474 [Bacteroidota bacterium]|nr:hypothetical protein [Bacteroidota bacterium]